jgi:hypothetical protein
MKLTTLDTGIPFSKGSTQLIHTINFQPLKRLNCGELFENMLVVCDPSFFCTVNSVRTQDSIPADSLQSRADSWKQTFRLFYQKSYTLRRGTSNMAKLLRRGEEEEEEEKAANVLFQAATCAAATPPSASPQTNGNANPPHRAQ